MHIIDENCFKRMKFHVFDDCNDPVGAFFYAEDAAMAVSHLGPGSCVTDPNGTVLWSEGSERFPAGESFDDAATLMHRRL